MTALDEVLQRAAAARNGERHGDALRLYEEASRIAPQLSAIRVECAHQLDLLGRSAEAEELYRILLDLQPQNARVHRGLAKACRERGLFGEALCHYRKAFELEPGIRWIASEYLDLLRSAGGEAEAEAVLAAIAEAEPRSAFPWIERARTARRHAQAEDVRAALVIALLRDPQSVEALGMLAMEERERGNEDLSIAACRRILDLDPAHVHAPLMEAAFHREAKRYAQSAGVLERALGFNPGHFTLRLDLAKSWRGMGRTGEARALLQALHADEPANQAVLQELAALEFEAGETGAGTSWIEVLLRQPQVSSEPLIGMARHYAARNRLGDARHLLAAAAVRGGQRALLVSEWAVLEAEAGHSRRAHELAEEALALAPDLFQACLLKAVLLLDEGRAEEALSFLQAKADRFGGRPDFHARLGQLLLQAGQFPESLAVLEAARRRFPDDFGVFNQWLAIAIRSGKSEEVRLAIAAYHPRNSEQARQLAIMAAQAERAAGHYKTAYQRLEQLTRQPEMPSYVEVEAARAAIALLDGPAARRHMKRYFDATNADNGHGGRKHNLSQSLIGQIADEFLLDPEAIAAARSASGLAEPERIAALLRAVADYPENTGCAMALLIALRESGHLDPPPEVDCRAAPRIPRSIIQYWDAPDIPGDIQHYCKSWQAQNPGFGYRMFSRATAAEYLAQHAAPEVRQAFRRMRLAAGRADIFRLALLAAEGGIYCDADDRCLGNLEPVIACGASLIVVQEDLGSIGNNFLAAEAGNAVIGRALRQAASSVNGGSNDSIWLATGPGQLSRSFAAVVSSAGDGWRDWLRTARVHNWTGISSFCAPHCAAAYKTTPASWSRVTS